ncbi:MAG: hypothetical protein Q7T46_10035 [Polaromonas sp.]|nr:hypothetical protein [Polaromonas sp.]
MFFLTNHLRAPPSSGLGGRTRNYHLPRRGKASFMVNKTSTIKRIFRFGRLPEKPVSEAMALSVEPKGVR